MENWSTDSLPIVLKLSEVYIKKHVTKLLQKIYKDSLVPYGDLVNPDVLKIVKELSGIATCTKIQVYTCVYKEHTIKYAIAEVLWNSHFC